MADAMELEQRHCVNAKPLMSRRPVSLTVVHFFSAEILSLPFMSGIIAPSAWPVMLVGVMLKSIALKGAGPETLNYISQQYYATHGLRINRHNAILHII